jgi:hypothetical protein
MWYAVGRKLSLREWCCEQYDCEMRSETAAAKTLCHAGETGDADETCQSGF